jgi:hypothetical protein
MQLYCVQTKAIQLYHVSSEQCYQVGSLDQNFEDEPDEINLDQETSITSDINTSNGSVENAKEVVVETKPLANVESSSQGPSKENSICN